jgi:formate-dependent nitrite reductase membrane component NrfD
MLLVAGTYALARDRSLLAIAALGSAPCIGLSLAVLVADLGRPERFWRMLARLNPRSVMSFGAFVLNGCFAIGLLAFLGRVFCVEREGFWRLIAVAACVVAPVVLAYKGVLLSVTAVAPWRHGRWFGALLLVDGIALGGALLMVATEGRVPALASAVALSSMVRVLMMGVALADLGEDRPFFMRGWIAQAYGGAMTLSLVSLVAPPNLGAGLTVLASGLLRAALVRSPYASGEASSE